MARKHAGCEVIEGNFANHDFAAIGLDVLDFSRDTSRVGTGEIWLGYLLRKTAVL